MLKGRPKSIDATSDPIMYREKLPLMDLYNVYLALPCVG
jgi:hypothetical protein